MVDFTRNLLLMILCFLVVRCWLLINVLGQFLSLLDSGAAFNLEIIRDCYEAFALYCFERYLIACLGMFEFGRVLFVLIYFCRSFLDVNNFSPSHPLILLLSFIFERWRGKHNWVYGKTEPSQLQHASFRRRICLWSCWTSFSFKLLAKGVVPWSRFLPCCKNWHCSICM